MLHTDFIPDEILFTPKSDRIDKQLFKEWIDTNDKQLLIIDNLYQQIKNFILKDLTLEQIKILSNYRSKRLFGNVDIKFNINLTNEYKNRYKNNNGCYEFTINTGLKQIPQLPIYICKKDNQNVKAAYENGDGDISKKCIYLYYIENNFSLRTVKSILDNKFDIVHELTHFLDDINTNGKVFSQTNNAYYNDSTEIHAFIQMMLSWLKEYLDSFEGINKFYKIKKSDLTPNKIYDIINKYLYNLDNDNPIYFYTIRDYNRMILQKHFEQMSDEVKKKICAKLAEELQNIIKDSVIGFTTLAQLKEDLPL